MTFTAARGPIRWILLALVVALPTHGLAQTLTVSGACPQPAETVLELSGFTEMGTVGLLSATSGGTFEVPGGPCAGTTLALNNPILVDQVDLNPSGGRKLTLALPPSACGGLVQVIDLATCQVSPVGTFATTDQAPFAFESIVDLEDPTIVTHAGDGSSRLFVAEQAGFIRILLEDLLLEEPFLDIFDRVKLGSEQGLLGLAFHPDFDTNGEFFVNYIERVTSDTIVSRFTVSADPDVGDPSSEEMLLRIPQPFSNHNAGQMEFGPDGFLYISTGDGGSADDPGNRAQDLGQLLGKMLRIDVDGGSPYAIPADNPFVDTPGARPEIWSYGLRNPWRFSFDRLTGDLFIGDVGQDLIEEISFQPASSQGAENYGWRRMEGSNCFIPQKNCNDGSLILPISEYPHFDEDSQFVGCSVTGGYVYRGTQVSDLVGTYIYGDFCTGTLWGVTGTPGNWTTEVLLETNVSLTTFGQDELGELYLAGAQGTIYRLVPAL